MSIFAVFEVALSEREPPVSVTPQMFACVFVLPLKAFGVYVCDLCLCMYAYVSLCIHLLISYPFLSFNYLIFEWIRVIYMQRVYGLGSIRACLFVSRARNRRFQMFWSQRVEPYNGLPILVFTYDVYIPYLCICACFPHICYAVFACARVECLNILYAFFVCASK